MSYQSTRAFRAVELLAVAVQVGVVRHQPAQAFYLTDQSHCAAVSNFNFYALSWER